MLIHYVAMLFLFLTNQLSKKKKTTPTTHKTIFKPYGLLLFLCVLVYTYMRMSMYIH